MTRARDLRPALRIARARLAATARAVADSGALTTGERIRRAQCLDAARGRLAGLEREWSDVCRAGAVGR